MGRIIEFVNTNELPQTEIVQLNQLCGFLLSNIGRLRAASEPRLIVKISPFLLFVQKGLERLKQFGKRDLIRHYQTQYQEEIQSQIAESDQLIQALTHDIQLSHEELEREIQGLVEEIQEVQREGEKRANKMNDQKIELIELKKKRVLLGTLQMAISAVGCCFPSFGGPLIAAAVNSGIGAIVNQDFEEVAMIGEAVQAFKEMPLIESQKGDLVNNEIYQLSRIVGSTRTVARIAKNVNEGGQSDDEKIAQIDQLIEAQENQVKELEKFKEQVSSLLKSSLDQFVNRAEKIQEELKTRSPLFRDFQRLEVKRVFQNITNYLKSNIDEGFKAQGKLLNIFEQIEDALVTSMNLYDRVQEYEDRGRLARYIGDVALAGSERNPKIERLRLATQRNIILEQYSRAVAAVQQWAFPFGSFFLGDMQSLSQFDKVATHEDLVKQATDQLERLCSKIEQYQTEIQPSIDNHWMRGTFTWDLPFHRWKDCKEKMRDLFQGKPIFLHADIANSSLYRSAIKFNRIRLEIRSTNPEVQAKWKDDEKKNLYIRLTHSGRSFYRYEDHIHEMFSEGPMNLKHSASSENSNASVSYEKIRRGDFVLSPYTKWRIELTREGRLNLFSKYKDHLDSFEIALVGDGTYVNEKKSSLPRRSL